MSNELSQELKQLHTPASPIIFANVWDLASLNAVLSLNTTDSKPVKGIATASWAIAAALGIKDEELSLEQNMAVVAQIAHVVRGACLPLSIDLQDGYGEQIEEVVASAVKLGAVGANIEDSIPSAGFDKGISGSLYDADTQVVRLRRALAAAHEAGCPDFVINARCDVFRLEPYYASDEETAVKEAVQRGRAYLEAGATTVFYWGGAVRGLRTSEVEALVRELGGRVAVKLGDRPDSLSTEELAQIGVARISIGPSLYLVAMNAMKDAARRILSGGKLAA
ncbi:carboxyphosphonoenolpyruvate phosphonomutase-like protein [Colletotrichum tofieldiae]|uniref:Carboxyphosphonoenolpyruvate phosphonomutase-like protein n=1 Tax=Colletotrichum tofieldiae TaxID=708197 RepID=A0A166TDN2_9PEZI|nr:carboxyphosphonoenolpyruvate phosphonomutase-like protein [Colletotrichum tofieldiae]GKT84491.1 carboxyphosphonoenolpyruvate phosphonomutase-like protein [Colletotrichum tofieldiae]